MRRSLQMETSPRWRSRVPRSISVYLGSPVWRACALSRSKADKFVLHALHVNLGIVGVPELALERSEVDEFVPQTQHVNLRIDVQPE